jgi:7-cyano-7-deazaguanine synthase
MTQAGQADKYTIAVVSGGLDSTTLVYDLISHGHTVDMVSFDYGQRHSRELNYAHTTSRQLGLRHDIINVSSMTRLFSESKSSLVNELVDVPEGHYAEENMKATVVPNRNMIMLSIAAGVAVSRNATGIATAVHSGDHFIYPDCRPRFISAANAAIVIGNEGFGAIPVQQEGAMPDRFILVPFLDKTKADIAYRALELGVPLHMTYSCYKGEPQHCGRCGTCVERLEAIHEAQTAFLVEGAAEKKYVDYTAYADTEYWKTVTAMKKKENVDG